mgnify:CR=1 FL=1
MSEPAKGTFHVDVREAEDGTFIARVQELQGCWAGGSSVEDALKILVELMPDYLDAFEGVQGAVILRVEPIGPNTGEGGDVIAHRELVLA